MGGETTSTHHTDRLSPAIFISYRRRDAIGYARALHEYLSRRFGPDQVFFVEALIAHPRPAIEKLRRELYGQRSERKARLLEQMELQLEELETAAAEDAIAAEAVSDETRPRTGGTGSPSASSRGSSTTSSAARPARCSRPTRRCRSVPSDCSLLGAR